jgi:exopolyphosphatase/guanosine-5'-triphosphate,3'-diphosphate pyrophosphatase
MSGIIARWEWRTFGSDFGEAEARIAEHPVTRELESSEIYILSARSGDNTKIRDALMDIKTLQRVNDDGLEQWIPVMKDGFPIAVDVLRKVYGHWNVEAPDLNEPAYSYEQFLGELVRVHPDLTAVDVFKNRTGYMIDDCIVEIANLRFNETAIRTVAVEMADPDLVMKTVKSLGLGEFENINYVSALKRFAGMPLVSRE